MIVKIININSSNSIFRRLNYNILLDDELVKLLESLNNTTIQPLLIYSDNRKKYSNINKKRLIKNIEEFDFDKVKENILILSSITLFLDKKNNINVETLTNFLEKCKKYNIDLIFKISVSDLFSTFSSILNSLDIKKDVFIIHDKSSIESLHLDIKRYITTKYLLEEN